MEELRQVVRFRRHRAGFDETRLEILLDALLAVKALHVWRAAFCAARWAAYARRASSDASSTVEGWKISNSSISAVLGSIAEKIVH